MRFVFRVLFTLVLAAVVFSVFQSLSRDGRDVGEMLTTAADDIGASIGGFFSSIWATELPEEPPDDSQKATVVAVHSAQVVDVEVVGKGDLPEGDARVFLAGLQPPGELGGDPFGSACYRTESDAAVKELLPVGSVVFLEPDAHSSARRAGLDYRWLWSANEVVNLRLVESGAAAVQDPPAGRSYIKNLRDAQSTAQEKAKGMWGPPCVEATPASDEKATEESA